MAVDPVPCARRRWWRLPLLLGVLPTVAILLALALSVVAPHEAARPLFVAAYSCYWLYLKVAWFGGWRFVVPYRVFWEGSYIEAPGVLGMVLGAAWWAALAFAVDAVVARLRSRARGRDAAVAPRPPPTA